MPTSNKSAADIAADTNGEKTQIGGDAAAKGTAALPKAVHEIHVSSTQFIAPGTVVSESIANEAGLDEKEITRLIGTGALILVDVFTGA